MDRIRPYLPALSDVLALIGVVLIGAGIWQIYPPAAFIVVGLILLFAAVRLG